MNTTKIKWQELPLCEVEARKEFQRIMQILNSYYAATKKEEPTEIRKTLPELGEQDFQLFIKKFGTHEYLIHVRVGRKNDSWIHIDGIGEERDRFKEQKLDDHPVFGIYSLGDLYRRTVVSKKRNLPK